MKRLLLVAVPGAEHVGAHFLYAAKEMGLEARLHNSEDGYRGPLWKRRINWWLRGRLPGRLDEFSAGVVESCREFQPDAIITTGIAPLSAAALEEIGRLGIPRSNFLTDDPWNRWHRAPWFLRALPRYDRVFSPRHANLRDLEKLGCAGVSYLPFAYSPEIHFPDSAAVPLANHDVVFVGGGDRDRMGPVIALIEAGRSQLQRAGCGCRSYAGTLVSVARDRLHHHDRVINDQSNRDGHSMRSYEVPAMRGCLLTEDTAEHREILGDTVLYFRDHRELVENARALLADHALRARLAQAAYARVTGGGNAYSDRLKAMLAV